MPNPRAQKQLALNSAVQELKTLGQPVQALGDMLASTLRGSVAATAGVGGDIRELIDLLGPEKVEALLGRRVMPTTEEMKGMLPKATSYEHPYESIGEFLPLPGTGTALKAAGYGAGRGAGALTRAAAETVNNAHVYGQGPLAAITPQPMRMFIGPQAKTYDVNRAIKAEEMLKAGASPQDVWKATGTMIGKDGIPRQEISDVGSTFRSPEDLKQLKESYKGMIEEGKEKLRPDRSGQKDMFPKQLTEAKKPFREQLAGLKEDLREIDKNPRTQGVAARWTLEHPELYRAYPQLADIPVTQTPTIGAEKGSLTYAGNRFDDLNVKDVLDPRSVSLHEMQHAIQAIERMSPGANPQQAFQYPDAMEILAERRKAASKPMPFEEYVKQGGYHIDDPEELERAKREYVDYANDMPELSKKYDQDLQRQAAMEWYKRQHGEAEARATQERRDLMPTQRLEKFPYESYDEPQEKLLLREPRPFEQNNPSQAELDQMRLELEDQKFAGGGITKLAKLARAPAKTKAEIEAIAERMAPQVTGEYVRESEKSAKTVAGKTQKQFQREKNLPVDIRANKGERIPEPIDIEKLKGDVMIGIPGDFTVAGKTLHGVGDVRLEMPSPQHGGPLYGLYHDDNHFWASGLDAAKKVQNLARSASEHYDAPVLGNYIMMGPESLNYALHFADANLQAIDPTKMTKSQIEGLNKLIREGYNYKKKGEHLQRVFPAFPGIEDKGSAYLHMAMDPDLRKHFNDLMQRSKVIEDYSLPSGQDIRYGVTEPALRDMEAGVTGYSMGRMRPDISAEDLKFSEHPTYSHDIPGHFMGQSKYPTPYELSFPDMVKSIRENPRQAPHEFGTLQYSGPHQTIDQQLIDEIRAYEERMRQLTGKKAGGAVMMSKGGEMSQVALDNLAKLKELRNKIAPVADAWTAKQAEDNNKYTPDIQQFKLPIGKAAGGEISADDLILEERPL